MIFPPTKCNRFVSYSTSNILVVTCRLLIQTDIHAMQRRQQFVQSITTKQISHNLLVTSAPLFFSKLCPLSAPPSMSFVKLSIFGTSFEVCTFLPELLILLVFHRSLQDMSISNLSEWVYLSFFLCFLNRNSCLFSYRRLWSRLVCPNSLDTRSNLQRILYPSSAKDQLTGASVAIKKIMKPFSTPVLSKRTYRELKLLKHIQHENVRLHPCLV